jgi:DNA-binding response OmpR family regulator
MNKLSAQDGRPTKVLCVDDDPTMRDMLGLYLDRKGYEVQTVDDGQVALGLLQADLARFDVVMTDNQMPVLSGLDLVKKLRAHGYEGGIVMFSSTVPAEEEERLSALRVHVVRKGAPIRELMAALAAAEGD